MTECKSQEDTIKANLTQGEVWVKFHNLPLESLKEEGLSRITKQVGLPLTDPIPFSSQGRNAFKIKMLINLRQPVKDKLRVDHASLGELLVYLTYERVGRICLFCGEMGHDTHSCAERARLVKVVGRMDDQNRPELQGILKPTIGQWVLDEALIPIQESQGGNSQQSRPMTPRPEGVLGLKRTFSLSEEPLNFDRPIKAPTDVNSSSLSVLGYLPENPTDALSDSDHDKTPLTYRKAKAARPSPPPQL